MPGCVRGGRSISIYGLLEIRKSWCFVISINSPLGAIGGSRSAQPATDDPGKNFLGCSTFNRSPAARGSGQVRWIVTGAPLRSRSRPVMADLHRGRRAQQVVFRPGVKTNVRVGINCDGAGHKKRCEEALLWTRKMRLTGNGWLCVESEQGRWTPAAGNRARLTREGGRGPGTRCAAVHRLLQGEGQGPDRPHAREEPGGDRQGAVCQPGRMAQLFWRIANPFSVARP